MYTNLILKCRKVSDKNKKLLELIKKRYTWDTSTFEVDKVKEVIKGKKSEKEKKQKEEVIKKVEKKEEKLNKEEKQHLTETEKEYKEALAFLKDAISPAFMKESSTHIQINNTFAKTFFVYAYPTFLEWNWLSPVINLDIKFDMSLFTYPIDSAFIQKFLKKRLVELNSERSINADKWLVNDTAIDAQIQDVEELRYKLTRWEEKYFHLSIYITIYSDSLEKLDKIWKNIETILSGRNVLQKQAYLRSMQGFISTGPFARDEIWVYRNMSTWGISTTFPFSSSTLSHDDWILYGINTHNNSLILYDRFKSENANMCVFAKSGWGKSFAVKLEILRSLMMWVDVIVIDPENEYKSLVDTVWGSYLDVSLNSSQRINPFDLPLWLKDIDEKPGDLLRSAIISILGLMNLMLWKLDATEESIMEKAIMTTYSLKWITMQNDDVEGKEIPVMSDLQDVLDTMEWAKSLVLKLEKYTSWIFSWIFSQHTNIDLKEWLQVFSVRDLSDIMRPTAMYVVLNYIWNKVKSSSKKRLLVIDEAWNIMQYDDSAQFLFWLVKRARKYHLWITTITQDIEDFVSSKYWKAIVTNSSIQLLLKQSSASIDALQNIFKLTEQEKYILLNASVWQWLFFAWIEHVWIQVLASYYEEQIVSSSPSEE